MSSKFGGNSYGVVGEREACKAPIVLGARGSPKYTDIPPASPRPPFLSPHCASLYPVLFHPAPLQSWGCGVRVGPPSSALWHGRESGAPVAFQWWPDPGRPPR